MLCGGGQEVVTPPVTSGNSAFLDSELAAGLKGNFDIVSFHFYTVAISGSPILLD